MLRLKLIHISKRDPSKKKDQQGIRDTMYKTVKDQQERIHHKCFESSDFGREYLH